eukprot:4585363-Prorocentrum_lima.AAC.1
MSPFGLSVTSCVSAASLVYASSRQDSFQTTLQAVVKPLLARRIIWTPPRPKPRFSAGVLCKLRGLPSIPVRPRT